MATVKKKSKYTDTMMFHKRNIDVLSTMSNRRLTYIMKYRNDVLVKDYRKMLLKFR